MPSVEAGDVVVELAGVAFDTRKARTLGPLDLRLERGESLSVIGPNGAGKTTLLRLVVGLLAPSEGRCRFDGRDYAELSRREMARRVAYVPQVRPAHVPLTVEQMLLLARYPYLDGWRRGPERKDFEVIERCLDQVGVAALRSAAVDELSGGERQLVHLAAALAQDCPVLVLDEPTSDLDPRHELEVTRILRQLRRNGEQTLLTATHDLAFAAHIADRVLALDQGKVCFSAPRAEALTAPRLEELFGARFVAASSAAGALPVLAMDE